MRAAMRARRNTNGPLRVWVADTPGGLCRELLPALAAAGMEPLCLDCDNTALPQVRAADCDVLILGIELPGEQGMERLRRFESGRLVRQVPVIVVADRPELEFELPDAFDFLSLPVDQKRLLADLELIAGQTRSAASSSATLAEADLRLFQDYLVLHSGLHFDQRNLRILERGLARRMRALGFDDYRRYYNYLQSCSDSRRELTKLLGLLTIGETYFFRYLAHFDALRHKVLPELIERNRQRRSLRLWSAGCSTGEEPYSLAILIKEHFPQLQDWDIRILASDINQQSLNKARSGLYGARSLRVADTALLRTWFRPQGREQQLDERIRKMVSFRYLNLQGEDYLRTLRVDEPFDVIFCRNVLIYFGQSTSRTVVAGFAGALRPGGYLFLGHAETLHNLSEDFERVIHQRSFFYRRRPKVAAAAQAQQTSTAVAPGVVLLPRKPVAPADSAPDSAALYLQAMASFNREDFRAAQLQFEQILRLEPGHAGALVGQGFVCANRREWPQAQDWCEAALRSDDLCAEAYFLKGLLCEALAETQAAREEYRKALLIDLDFIMPHYRLAGLFEQQGLLDDARRELRNTLRLLEKWPSESQVPYSGGLSREVFLEVCRAHLNRLSELTHVE